MTMTGLERDAATAYRNFATREAHGNSPEYEAICTRIADDAQMLALITELPEAKRQPNLVLGAARYLGGSTHDAGGFITSLRQHWAQVREVVLARATQTNEVGRCATLLPFLAEAADAGAGASARGRRLALVEVGCSAGLALYPDLYAYEYVDDRTGSAFRVPVERIVDAGPGPRVAAEPSESVSTDPCGDIGGKGSTARPTLTCRVTEDSGGLVRGTRLPSVAWRGGLDLNPLDVVSSDDEALDNARWLRALVWPGQDERAARLDAAIATVRHHLELQPDDAAHIVTGDVVDDLDAVLTQVPDDLHLVVFHSAVLAYVDEGTREAFERRMRELAARPGGFTWISNEAPSVMPAVRDAVSTIDDADLAGRFVLAVDGVPRALTGPHGQSLTVLNRQR